MSIIDKVEVDGTIYDIVGGGILPHLVISTDSGLTVTATKGTTVITATETSSGVYECDVPEFGTYTITATKGSEVVTKEFNVTSVSIFNIVLSFIPDGDTVLPTDDVTTWLECAGIKDKSYTTLQQVLADSITFNALLGDSNANAYLARSMTFATTLCASQYAMNMIGQYDVCCDALLGNSTWASAIGGSTYWDSVLKGLVPIMTSDTTPSGTIFYSGNRGNGYDAYRAFDGTASDGWNNDGSNYYIHVGNYIGYTFNEPIEVYKCMSCLGYYDRAFNIAGKIQASNDGTNWTDLTEIFNTSCNSTNTWTETVFTKNVGAYSSYRWICTTAPTHGYYGGFNLQFYGRISQTDKIHGANNEVAYYLDGATQVPISDPSTLDAGTYTFGSTVAKNPDSLATDYTKSIRITPNTVEVVLRPDNALYWYGYESSDLCDTTSANGYSWVGGSVGAPTHNTHDITCTTSSNTMKGIAVTDAINLSKIYVVVKGVTVVSGDYGLCYILTSKNISVPAINSSETITSASVTKITVNATAQGNYVPVIASYNGKSARIDALMYE